MRFRSIFSIVVLTLCLAAPAAGREPVRDFRLAVGRNPLLSFDNAAALTSLGEAHFSEATGSFTKDNGALIPLDASPDSWKVDVGTQSFQRISPRIVLAGALSYAYFSGNDMGGQILMNPLESPVNFLEEDGSTVGKKRRETYFLRGALAYSFSDRFSSGIRVEYTSADQAKLKDPRFLNVVMDLRVAPGVMWHASEQFSLGGNLIYRHSLEQLTAGLFGTIERQYDILVDQGGFLGVREVFEGDAGYVSTSNMRPMSNERYGLSLQTVIGTRVKYHGQLSALWRTGYYGSRTSSSVVFCEFRGPEATIEGVWLIPSRDDLHRIEYSIGAKYLSRLTNSYTYKTETGMATTVEYQGQNETLTRLDLEARAAYRWEKGVSGYRPDWVLSASAEGFMRRQDTFFYPASRHQDYLNLSALVAGERNFKRPANCFTLAAGLSFAWGTGDPKTDGALSGGESKLKSFDEWLYRQFEYDTAMRAGASLSFTWTLLRFSRLVPYLGVSDRFVTLLSAPQYLQNGFRNEAVLTLGVNF